MALPNDSNFFSSPVSNVPEAEIMPYVPLQSAHEEKTSVAADILGFTGATLGDFAASVYNSLPFLDTIQNRDLIAKIGDNSLRMYDEHPDAVNTASFIGGVFVPAGIAMKSMQAARAGITAENWFSKAGKVKSMSELNSVLKASSLGSAEYKTALKSLYLRDFANVVVDNAAMELAIVGTMNAHPTLKKIF
jgi:hypothetical protein